MKIALSVYECSKCGRQIQRKATIKIKCKICHNTMKEVVSGIINK